MSINYSELRQMYRRGYNLRKQADAGMILVVCILMGLMLVIFAGCVQAQEVDMVLISQIESSNNVKAFNKSSGAIGLCQITAPVLQDFNKIMKTSYTTKDLYNGQLNIMIADWYMNHEIPIMLKYYGIKDSVRNRLIAYNFGVGNLKKGKRLPKETVDYIVKYEGLGGKL